MSDLSRYAVFGLFDEATARRVRSLQHRLTERTGNRTVLFFPVHVTIRGRFWARPCLAEEGFRRFRKSNSYDPGLIELTGPAFHAPDLVWLEIGAATHGFQELGRMHRDANETFRSVLEKDEVLPRYAGDGFFPHVTLGWGCAKENADELLVPSSLATIAGRLTSLALVRYPTVWPVNEDLDMIELANL